MVMVVLALALGFAFVPRAMRSCNSASTSGPAPDFTANVVANRLEAEHGTLTLSALKGHPVVLDFWATWCGPCQAEAPIMNGLAKRYKDRGLVVVGVNTSDAEGLAEKFAARKGLGFPIVYDEGNDIAKKYGVDSLPTLVVVSKEGNVVAVRRGVTSESDLARLVDPLL